MIEPLTYAATLSDYESQAQELLAAFQRRDDSALDLFKNNHPKFLREDVTWAPKWTADEELRTAALDLTDAKLALARWYGFDTWDALAKYAATSATDPFEAALHAVITGDEAAL